MRRCWRRFVGDVGRGRRRARANAHNLHCSTAGMPPTAPPLPFSSPAHLLVPPTLAAACSSCFVPRRLLLRGSMRRCRLLLSSCSLLSSVCSMCVSSLCCCFTAAAFGVVAASPLHCCHRLLLYRLHPMPHPLHPGGGVHSQDAEAAAEAASGARCAGRARRRLVLSCVSLPWALYSWRSLSRRAPAVA